MRLVENLHILPTFKPQKLYEKVLLMLQTAVPPWKESMPAKFWFEEIHSENMMN